MTGRTDDSWVESLLNFSIRPIHPKNRCFAYITQAVQQPHDRSAIIMHMTLDSECIFNPQQPHTPWQKGQVLHATLTSKSGPLEDFEPHHWGMSWSLFVSSLLEVIQYSYPRTTPIRWQRQPNPQRSLKSHNRNNGFCLRSAVSRPWRKVFLDIVPWRNCSLQLISRLKRPTQLHSTIQLDFFYRPSSERPMVSYCHARHFFSDLGTIHLNPQIRTVNIARAD